ncbi:hypothetical protein F4780DRAFT_776607 [Xylariomycetidae sp. FL0641]|nr:hypothetical protein F4780DRAFT_776607 [Xylariomycetidae sp. FL0641]
MGPNWEAWHDLTEECRRHIELTVPDWPGKLTKADEEVERQAKLAAEARQSTSSSSKRSPSPSPEKPSSSSSATSTTPSSKQPPREKEVDRPTETEEQKPAHGSSTRAHEGDTLPTTKARRAMAKVFGFTPGGLESIPEVPGSPRSVDDTSSDEDDKIDEVHPLRRFNKPYYLCDSPESTEGSLSSPDGLDSAFGSGSAQLALYAMTFGRSFCKKPYDAADRAARAIDTLAKSGALHKADFDAETMHRVALQQETGILETEPPPLDPDNSSESEPSSEGEDKLLDLHLARSLLCADYNRGMAEDEAVELAMKESRRAYGTPKNGESSRS